MVKSFEYIYIYIYICTLLFLQFIVLEYLKIKWYLRILFSLYNHYPFIHISSSFSSYIFMQKIKKISLPSVIFLCVPICYILVTSICSYSTGAKYELPKYVLSEPTNLVEESWLRISTIWKRRKQYQILFCKEISIWSSKN